MKAVPVTTTSGVVLAPAVEELGPRWTVLSVAGLDGGGVSVEVAVSAAAGSAQGAGESGAVGAETIVSVSTGFGTASSGSWEVLSAVALAVVPEVDPATLRRLAWALKSKELI